MVHISLRTSFSLIRISLKLLSSILFPLFFYSYPCGKVYFLHEQISFTYLSSISSKLQNKLMNSFQQFFISTILIIFSSLVSYFFASLEEPRIFFISISQIKKFVINFFVCYCFVTKGSSNIYIECGYLELWDSPWKP